MFLFVPLDKRLKWGAKMWRSRSKVVPSKLSTLALKRVPGGWPIGERGLRIKTDYDLPLILLFVDLYQK